MWGRRFEKTSVLVPLVLSASLLFFATTINYMDRQIIAILKPVLQSEIRWNEIDYSNIVFAFQLAYAIALLFAYYNFCRKHMSLEGCTPAMAKELNHIPTS